MFALYKCLLAFEPYIVYNKFIVRTDNTQVKWWITKKIDDSVTTKEIRRMILNILNFTFTIEIIKTDENLIADYLSRKRYDERSTGNDDKSMPKSRKDRNRSKGAES